MIASSYAYAAAADPDKLPYDLSFFKTSASIVGTSMATWLAHRRSKAALPVACATTVGAVALGVANKVKKGAYVTRTWAKDFWQAQGVETGNPRRPLLLVNTRTTWPDKNWPAENFGHCLRALGPHIQIVFTGAAADAPCIAKAQQMLGRPSLSIAGKTTLSELAALFAEADLLLTGDTGPLYIAEAVGLPTLSLWGPTHPDIYGPLTSGHHFVLSPHSCTACCKTKCRHHTNACMNAITPESVTEKIKRLLQ